LTLINKVAPHGENFGLTSGNKND